MKNVRLYRSTILQIGFAEESSSYIGKMVGKKAKDKSVRFEAEFKQGLDAVPDLSVMNTTSFKLLQEIVASYRRSDLFEKKNKMEFFCHRALFCNNKISFVDACHCNNFYGFASS
ncbi:hypothetical protein B9Z55_022961 [Caenorhabditis nigoni]|uniref:Uncharacterized protein n=1 Tax=Caenorhabditis nigoni TaxID=1611254 RepID=A0A2G5SN48_9PELO|nr:hypothetical protein B9Z55_022961 [Caenorhabditis nigoni]